MDIKQRQLVKKYLDLFFRRKLFIIIVFLLSLPIGLGIYLSTPKEYKSSCLLSYQQQKINPNELSPDVKSSIKNIVNTLSQVVISRTNLEKIILEFDLYPEQRKQRPIEDVVRILSGKIAIESPSRGNVFTISYTGSDQDKVARVTNAVAGMFIEENLKYRQERATDTSSYTNQELQMAKKGMDEKENAMRDYKLKHYDEMPEHRQANVSTLTSLQRQYQGKQESIQDLERTLILIQDQVNNRKMLLQRPTGKGADDGELSSAQQLANLHTTLDSLLLKYTEKHPEIKRIRKLIQKLEIEVKSGTRVSRSTASNALQKQSGENQNESYDQTLMQLETQRNDIKRNIANIESEKSQLKEKIVQTEKWIETTPTREAEWSSLTREYGQFKKHYDYLVAQNLKAESMLNLEERQKGSQFKIEDSAGSSGKPVRPKFLNIMGISIAIGLGLGVVVTFVLDFFDGSFRDPETLESLLGVPLLITIPHIETKGELQKKARLFVLKASMLLLGSGLVLALFVVVWTRGYIIL
jgi:polysaccharide chain length determinant protein (PEP-CTERM system associated)